MAQISFKMKLNFQVGKYYRTRDGRKAKCLISSDYMFCRFMVDNGEMVKFYNTDLEGNYTPRLIAGLDIVGEWAEPQPRNPAKEAYKRAMSEQRKERDYIATLDILHARINYRSHMDEPCVNVGYAFTDAKGVYTDNICFVGMHEDWLKVPNQKGYPKSLNL